MTRGNQREKAREKNQKVLAASKSKNAKSGAEQAKEKEETRLKMLQKQQAADEKKKEAELKAIEEKRAAKAK